MKCKIVLVLVAFIASGHCFSQGVKSLTKGQKIVQVTKNEIEMKLEMMGQEVEQAISTVTTAELGIADLSSNGAKIEMKLTKMKMSMSAMGQDMSYDSEKPNDNELTKEMGKSLNRTSIFNADAKGIITSLEMDEEVKSMMKNAPTSGMAKGQPVSFLIELPTDAAVNSSWDVSYGEDSTAKMTYHYTVKSMDNGVATLLFTGTMKSNTSMNANNMEISTKLAGTINGTALVNAKTYIVKSRTSTMDMKGTMEMSGQSIPMEMKASTEESFN